MSKTYRRNKSKTPNWVKTDNVISKINGRIIHTTVELKGKDLDKSIAIYHSDRNINSIPLIFKKHLERIKRSRDKVVLDNINKLGYYDEYIFNLRKNDLKYNYW